MAAVSGSMGTLPSSQKVLLDAPLSLPPAAQRSSLKLTPVLLSETRAGQEVQAYCVPTRWGESGVFGKQHNEHHSVDSGSESRRGDQGKGRERRTWEIDLSSPRETKRVNNWRVTCSDIR